MHRFVTSAFVIGALAAGPAVTAAQQPQAGGRQPAAGAPAQGGGERGQGAGRGEGRGRGRGGPQGAQPLNLDDRTGFEPIFDGTLKNWDGDTAYWRAQGNTLVGETTADNALKQNTFIIWRGGEPADFELKLEFRMNATNSGIQFRSQQVPPGTPGGRSGEEAGKWVLRGYQADIDHDNRYTGMIYEERGRGFLMQRGQAVYISPTGSKHVIGNLERSADELKAIIKPGDWNHVHLIARGNTLMHIVNGHVTAVIIDDDAKGRAMKGLIGLQLHTGPPMKIEFRNLYLKKL